ncbi:unnamed protein product [Amoebophrya sp. A120]|nr:unnamed protein product [Amoebophrya sp. A120]|eukprot:GSA120T00014529001.1
MQFDIQVLHDRFSNRKTSKTYYRSASSLTRGWRFRSKWRA